MSYSEDLELGEASCMSWNELGSCSEDCGSLCGKPGERYRRGLGFELRYFPKSLKCFLGVNSASKGRDEAVYLG